ncbi:hypothetical protein P4S72_06735 [Vibrio sp. PP-XX7]
MTGLSHNTTQDFTFYDLTDTQQQSALEQKKKTEAELNDTTIYSWDWGAESGNRNVGLRVQSGNGPITLPLFRDVADTKRQPGEQKYLVQAFIPLTVLPTFNALLNAEERTAPFAVAICILPITTNSGGKSKSLRQTPASPVLKMSIYWLIAPVRINRFKPKPDVK